MVPASVKAHVDALFHEDRDAWRAVLASRLPELVERWDLRLGEVMTGGWNSVVVGCDAPDGRAVLKLTLSADAVALEGRALRHWGPRAAVIVFACDATRGALLLERLAPATVMPGTSAAVDAAAEMLGALHGAGTPPDGVPSVADLYADAEQRLSAMWQRCPSAVSAERAEQAARQLRELAAAPVPGGPVLLHGDPVPANFLLGAAGYRAIDPRPRAGDPAYDAAFWALFSDDGREAALKAERLAGALGLDGDRVSRWARAMAVDRLLQVADSPHHTGLVERLSAFAGPDA